MRAFPTVSIYPWPEVPRVIDVAEYGRLHDSYKQAIDLWVADAGLELTTIDLLDPRDPGVVLVEGFALNEAGRVFADRSTDRPVRAACAIEVEA